MPGLITGNSATQDRSNRTGGATRGLSGLLDVLPFRVRGGKHIGRAVRGGRPLEALIRIPNGGATQAPGTGQMIRQVREKVKRRDWAGITAAISALERAPGNGGLGPRRTESVVRACLEATTLDELARAETEDPENGILASVLAIAILDGNAPDAVELASRILEPHDPVAMMSPLLAEAHLRLVLRTAEDPGEIIAAFEDWSDLDPTDLLPFRLTAERLFARWGVNALLNEADRAAVRLKDVLGQGAYAAMALEAVRPDNTRAQEIDTRRFLEGLGDLCRRGAEQSFINEFSARIAGVVFDPAPLFGRGDAPLKAMKEELKLGLRELLRRYLRSIEPSAWEHGRDHALRVLADLFDEELSSGARLRFTACGLLVQGADQARA